MNGTLLERYYIRWIVVTVVLYCIKHLVDNCGDGCGRLWKTPVTMGVFK